MVPFFEDLVNTKWQTLVNLVIRAFQNTPGTPHFIRELDLYNLYSLAIMAHYDRYRQRSIK